MSDTETTHRVPVPGVEGTVEVKVPSGWTLVSTKRYERLQRAATLLSDLDRSDVGRHKGDVESQDPSGISQGTPHLSEGQRIGTTLSGAPIYYPYFDRADLGDVDNWIIGDADV